MKLRRQLTAIPLLMIACSKSAGSRASPSSAAGVDSLSLVDAATGAYHAELAAMSAYARAECQECPAEAPFFLAGSRHAFEMATRLYPQDPRSFIGLANVYFSMSFDGKGDPIDSVLNLARKAAEDAVALPSTASVHAQAETLLARIKSAH